MQDISGFGLKVTVIATGTYPSGIVLTKFPDDTDPLDFPDVDIAEYFSGLNGDLIKNQHPQPIEVNLSVIAKTADAAYLETLFNANRVGLNRRSNNDVITLIVAYPDGTIRTCINGGVRSGKIADSIASDGRTATRVFGFTFEDVI
jgi:hypothetical protein